MSDTNELRRMKILIAEAEAEVKIGTVTLLSLRRDMRKLRKLLREGVQTGEITQIEAKQIEREPQQVIEEVQISLLRLRKRIAEMKAEVRACQRRS